ncbi:MAG: hypothetical protein J0H88_22990 [Sphingomonadales bacterium]|nr:hypothetical protein [Sphingomonadales bacterium]
MSIFLNSCICSWGLRDAMTAHPAARTRIDSMLVTLSFHGRSAVGEAVGLPGETVHTMRAAVERIRAQVEGGLNRRSLLALLPPGGARNALDAALWDLEAKLSGVPAWQIAGLPEPTSACASAATIWAPESAAYEDIAREYAHHPILKICLRDVDPIEALRSVRRAAPQAKLIVDPGQGWYLSDMQRLRDPMIALGVGLIEQPVPPAEDERLVGFDYPIPICADPTTADVSRLRLLARRYQYVRVELNRMGGLTAAIAYVRAARRNGLKIVVASRPGSSLATAPARLLADSATFAELSGPTLLTSDWPNPITYRDGMASAVPAALWG